MASDTYEIQVDDGTRLAEALVKLIKKYEEIHRVWESPEQMDRDTLLLRNETDIALFNGLETVLEDRDMLTVLPLVHGG